MLMEHEKGKSLRMVQTDQAQPSGENCCKAQDVSWSGKKLMCDNQKQSQRCDKQTLSSLCEDHNKKQPQVNQAYHRQECAYREEKDGSLLTAIALRMVQNGTHFSSDEEKGHKCALQKLAFDYARDCQTKKSTPFLEISDVIKLVGLEECDDYPYQHNARYLLAALIYDILSHMIQGKPLDVNNPGIEHSVIQHNESIEYKVHDKPKKFQNPCPIQGLTHFVIHNETMQQVIAETLSEIGQQGIPTCLREKLGFLVLLTHYYPKLLAKRD